jgi:hypothetical protein
MVRLERNRFNSGKWRNNGEKILRRGISFASEATESLDLHKQIEFQQTIEVTLHHSLIHSMQPLFNKCSNIGN